MRKIDWNEHALIRISNEPSATNFNTKELGVINLFLQITGEARIFIKFTLMSFVDVLLKRNSELNNDDWFWAFIYEHQIRSQCWVGRMSGGIVVPAFIYLFFSAPAIRSQWKLQDWSLTSFSVSMTQNSKYKLEGKILHQQCNRLFPARCQTYAN